MKQNLKILTAAVKRLGVVIEPNGDQLEADGMLNPASAFDREGNLILYPRVVAPGNESRVGLIKVSEDKHGGSHPERLGYALVPEADYERNGACGQGCEDPRVTFVPELDVYLMAYTAYGTQGPRPAIAFSRDAYNWERLGLIEFPQELQLSPDDKDVAFFPEPVVSPKGVLSIAFYHRPMVDIPPEGGMDFIQTVLSKRADQRQCIRIAYVPLDQVHADLKNLVKVTESVVVLEPGSSWGRVKVGGGTAPVRIAEGWLSLYHGVDAVEKEPGKYAMRYSAGIIVHDARQPHKVLFHSAEAPVFVPETEEELKGTVNNVVFPTALVPRSPRTRKPVADSTTTRNFDVWYGMADYRIGRIRLTLPRYRRAS